LSSTARGGKAALLLLLVATPLVAADVAMLDRSIAGCDAGKNNDKREILNRFLRFYVPSFFFFTRFELFEFCVFQLLVLSSTPLSTRHRRLHHHAQPRRRVQARPVELHGQMR